MKVILKQDVPNLGGAGEIVEVADGYGNNFLVPRNLAMLASKGAAKDAEAMRQARVKREAKTLGEAQELKERLEARSVTVNAKAGEDGTLYGSVGNAVVAAAIKEQLGVPVDRRRVPMDKPFKHLGTHEVEVRIHPEVTATIRVEVARGT
ncbi:MAG: 50S ribosomal protein L9 [Nitriliruptorales bacterium]|nr:50S ribosomal protein L9 [Nitriliruptorales bacterium]